MQTKTLFILSIGWLGLMSSCSSNEDFSCIGNYTTGKESIEIDEELQKRYKSIDAEWYVGHYPEYFGEKVLIFNQLEDVDNLLSNLEDMHYQELCNWYATCPIRNSIIESNIIYDTKLTEAATIFGIDFDKESIEIKEETLSEIYSLFTRMMQDEYPRLCKTDSTGHIYVRPTGHIDDIPALCNDKHLMIVDKIVYRIDHGFILTCPIDKYVLIPNDIAIHELWELYNADAIPHISADDDISITKAPTIPNQEITHEDIKSHIVKKGNYTLSVYLTAYPVWGWGTTNIRGKVIIDNYYKGNRHKTQTDGRIKYDVQAYFPNRNITNKMHFSFPASAIDGRYKSKTLRATYWGNFYCPTKRTNADIIAADISISQPSTGINLYYTK